MEEISETSSISLSLSSDTDDSSPLRTFVKPSQFKSSDEQSTIHCDGIFRVPTPVHSLMTSSGPVQMEVESSASAILNSNSDSQLDNTSSNSLAPFTLTSITNDLELEPPSRTAFLAVSADKMLSSAESLNDRPSTVARESIDSQAPIFGPPTLPLPTPTLHTKPEPTATIDLSTSSSTTATTSSTSISSTITTIEITSSTSTTSTATETTSSTSSTDTVSTSAAAVAAAKPLPAPESSGATAATNGHASPPPKRRRVTTVHTVPRERPPGEREAGVGAHEAGAHEAGIGAHDAGAHEAGAHEAIAHEAGAHEAGVGAHEAGAHEAGAHEAGAHEAGAHKTHKSRPASAPKAAPLDAAARAQLPTVRLELELRPPHKDFFQRYSYLDLLEQQIKVLLLESPAHSY